MFKATLLVSFLFLSPAFAATKSIYKLNINLKMNGRTTDQSVVLPADEQVTLDQGKYSFITVTPSEISDEPGRVHLKLSVGTIVKGQRQIVSTPEMIIAEGKRGSIAVGEDDGLEAYTLTVLANRQVTEKK